VFPTVSAVVEIETAEGRTVRREPELPVPFLYAWLYRVARHLRVPIVSNVEPSDLALDVPVPGAR
jgi:hypothetical protein